MAANLNLNTRASQAQHQSGGVFKKFVRSLGDILIGNGPKAQQKTHRVDSYGQRPYAVDVTKSLSSLTYRGGSATQRQGIQTDKRALDQQMDQFLSGVITNSID